MRRWTYTVLALVACGGIPAQPSKELVPSAQVVADMAAAPRVKRLTNGADRGELVLGGLHHHQVKDVLAKDMATAEGCLSGRSGEVQVGLVIKADGSVKNTRVKRHTVGDDDAAGCAADAFASASFPPPAGGGLTVVTWPVTAP